MNSSQRRENFLPKEAKLSLCSLVNPALIPLYARAGASVELHSTSEETTEWLKSRLLGGIWLHGDDDGELLERFSTIQCPVGLLVSVDLRQTSQSYPSANNVSDLLVYGILSSSHQESRNRPPSPPDSSSLVDAHTYEQDVKIKRDLRIYAVPLAASYVQKVQDLPSPPSCAAEEGDAALSKDAISTTTTSFAQFLPDLRSPSPKRKRILSLFEGAAQHHRRVRQRGGEAISQMMANPKSQISQLSSLRIKKEVEEDISPTLEKLELRRARSLSLGGNHLYRLGDNVGIGERSSRPGSSKGMLSRRDFKSKQITPHDSNSSDSLVRSQSVMPSPTFDFVKPIPPNDAALKLDPQSISSLLSDGESVVTRNKDLITWTILTCMRLYGYNRKASRSAKSFATVIATESMHESDSKLQMRQQREDSTVQDYTTIPEDAKLTTSGAAGLATDEEEFKAMYYATYKAANFALRHYLKTVAGTTEPVIAADKTFDRILPPVLSKDTATNVIDGILKLFCDDHMKPKSI